MLVCKEQNLSIADLNVSAVISIRIFLTIPIFRREYHIANLLQIIRLIFEYYPIINSIFKIAFKIYSSRHLDLSFFLYNINN